MYTSKNHICFLCTRNSLFMYQCLLSFQMEHLKETKKNQITEFTRTFLRQVLNTGEHLPFPIRAHLSKIIHPDVRINNYKAWNKLCIVCGFDLLNGSMVTAERKKWNKKILYIKCLACSSLHSKVRFGRTRKKNDETKNEASKTPQSSLCNTRSNTNDSNRKCCSTGRRRFKRVEKLKRLAEMNKSIGSDSPLNNSLSSFLMSFTK